VLIAAIAASYTWTGIQPRPPIGSIVEDTTSDWAAAASVLLTALDEHFAQTEMLLVG
jgi:hypothetical protein